MHKAFAVLRIFFGVILFANGVAKLFDVRNFSIGPYVANLVNRDLARIILMEEGDRTRLPLVESVADAMVAQWSWVQWLVTVFELGVGALLIVGIATRGAALVDLGQQLFLAALYASSNRWAFEQPHEYIPLILFALVPAGRVWGLDRRVIATRPSLRRWPF